MKSHQMYIYFLQFCRQHCQYMTWFGTYFKMFALPWKSSLQPIDFHMHFDVYFSNHNHFHFMHRNDKIVRANCSSIATICWLLFSFILNWLIFRWTCSRTYKFKNTYTNAQTHTFSFSCTIMHVKTHFLHLVNRAIARVHR